MSIQSEQLKERTMTFAEACLRIVDRLPRSASGRTIAVQLAKSATSIAANYRATCNSRSRAEFIAELGVVVEETDESWCWLELIRRRRMVPEGDVKAALIEAFELRAIFGKSVGTARSNDRLRRGPSVNHEINKSQNNQTMTR